MFRHSFASLVAVGLVALSSALTVGAGQARADDQNVPKVDILAGDWTGRFHYPEDGTIKFVRFEMKITVDGAKFTATTKEPNTFGQPDAEFLLGKCTGQFDAKIRKVTWVKTYDGTGGVDHSVDYSGVLSQDGTTIEGTWSIGDTNGKFFLEARPKIEVLAGDWTGRFHYPDNSSFVRFEMKIALDGGKFKATTKEPNTFGRPEAEFLFGKGAGDFDAKTRKVTWVKTYDGTGGVDHSVDYSGVLSQDGSKIEGTWSIGDTTGKFFLEKAKPKAK